ncbi:hemolysin family protein [Micromonospora sp. NBC_01796]|uniref:hemolysin family protein n=1 Tax=Micromonospora sp. NBC_01796 TaxID=2975987 RepID=UPI002DD814C2|nr:hemolysin family protein [Micromonospora sp. NBC_01796]WSA84404.1 hemolysin family protein [Micromonospora sp. NBC_01796]
MGGYGFQVALVAVLVLVNAVFSGSEMALVSLRESQLQRLERGSRTGRVLARLARDPNRFLATIQIGITLAGFLASAAAAVSLSAPLVEPLGFLGSAAEPVSIVLVTIVLTFLTLVFGELAPKRIAMQRTEGWALVVARPLDMLSTFSRPAVWLLSRATNTVVRLTGADPDGGREEVTAEELRDMVAAQPSLTAEHRTIISGAFEVADRILREILVPRGEVTTLPADMPTAEGLRVLAKSGQSRAPVVTRAGLDNVVGVVHLRDLLDGTGVVADHASEALFMPETLGVTDAIRQMRQQRQQFALVVDERGSIDGIVTMEDLIEEIVGEIYDETDRDVQAVIREPGGTLLLSGTFPIHDLPDLGLDLDEADDGDYTTIAGLVLARLGHIPTAPGETIEVPAFTAAVVEVTGHAITKVRLRPRSGESAGGDDEVRQASGQVPSNR